MKRYLITRTVLAMAVVSACMSQVAFAGFLGNLDGLSKNSEAPNHNSTSSMKKQTSHKGSRSGDRVIGQWSDGEWYPATVKSSDRNGYKLTFDDGDTAVVTKHQIHPFNWRNGSRVQCKWQNGSLYYTGVIASINGRSLNINYDDGDRETTTTQACRDANGLVANTRGYVNPRANNRQPANSNRHQNGFQRGDRILGQWSDGMWYPATIQRVQNSRYHLQFADGDQLTVQSHQLSAFNWRQGSRVQCNYQAAGTYYDGVINRINGGNLSLTYSQDGISEMTLVKHCRTSSNR